MFRGSALQRVADIATRGGTVDWRGKPRAPQAAEPTFGRFQVELGRARLRHADGDSEENKKMEHLPGC